MRRKKKPTPTVTNKHLGEFVKRLRVERNVTQVQMGEGLGQPQSNISRIESGERVLQFLEAMDMCDVLKVTPEHFVAEYRKSLSR